ncbi:hypothetical protein SDC9_143361 [bioreactor metagenome]|uniref:Uncharacterized protein n=1 Tax=bioreactor metagenome TaxID=1076179 RepID=A0A645E5W7_9ZZZZ
MTPLRSNKEKAALIANRKKIITMITGASALQSTSIGAVNQRQIGKRLTSVK